MFTSRKKIVKESGEPTAFEDFVAQALFDLEANTNELKADLRAIHITGAEEVDVGNNKKAVVIWVPYRLLKQVHKIQARLVRELEKKFSGKHVVLVASRRVLPPITRANRQKSQRRPVSRTLTAVHDAILEDLVYPTEVTGKRTRYRLDGSRLIKVELDRKDHTNVEPKLDTFATVYKRLTGKDVTFDFAKGGDN